MNEIKDEMSIWFKVIKEAFKVLWDREVGRRETRMIVSSSLVLIMEALVGFVVVE